MNPTSPHLVKITLVLTLLFSAGNVFSQIIYVSTAGDDGNTGDSWAEAYRTLTHAIDQSGPGDDIWVAQGTYYPVDCDPCATGHRELSFDMPNMVRIYGGFDGTESSLSERDPEMNETILSGDINGTGNHDGNSYSVVNGSGVDNTAVLDGFTITLGNADGSSPDPSDPSRSGGGIYISFGSPTFSNLIVKENLASNTDNRGGGMHVFGISSEPVMSNSVFLNNDGFLGGAINLHANSNLTLVNCSIVENTGGGIYLWSNTIITISDCLIEGNSGGPALTTRLNSIAHINNSSFIGNTAGQAGGGVFNWDSELYVKNSVFSENTADTWGGAIYNTGGSVFEATNSLFYGNTAGTEGGAIFRINTTPVKLINCVISGNSAGSQGGGISNPDQFGSIEIVNSILWNNQANNQNNTLSASIFNSNPSNVDISYSLIANSGGSSNWNTNTGIDLGNNIDLDPLFVEDVDLGNLPTSDGDLRLTSCSPAIDAGNPDTTGLNLPELDLDNNPRIFNATGTAGDVIDMGAYEFPDSIVGSGIIYVNASNPASGSGYSWECAFTDLQDALAIAQAGDTIWVAAGTYFPTFDPMDREASFFLLNDVAIYGGFFGNETELSERTPGIYETILSGDINNSGDHDGNSNSVVNGSNTNNSAVLDGFTIRMGNADFGGPGSTSAPDRSGAGIYISNGSPLLNNLIVEENITLGGGNRGGGIYVDGASAHPIIENSTIRNNEGSEGGGINVRGDGNLTISNSDILENTGGGIFVQQNVNIFISGCLLEGNTGRSALTVSQNSFAQIEHTTIIENSGVFAGGAILNYSSDILVLDCIISGNAASSIGGAIYNGDPFSWGAPNFEARNSLFHGNIAGSSNGGVFYNLNNAQVRLINCVLSGNSAGNQGGALFNQDDATVELINTIIWNNRASGQTNTLNASITNAGNASCDISYSVIANSGGSSNWNANAGTDLGDNIDLDPLFVEDVDLGNLPTSDGDLRLTNCSPAIDAGNPDTTGLNLPEFDLDGNARIFNATGIPGDVIDMGAYEFQSTVPVDRPNTLYVNADNPTPGKGRSWDCAFSDLQLALAVAEAGDSIWVAAGTYLPTTNELDRDASFFLINEVAIYGGFSGGETSLVQRDWENNETILSGDINQTGDQDGNSYTVVNGSNTNNSAVLDGFTIKMGNANFVSGPDSNPNRSGGGLYNNNGSPTIANCYITGNFAVQDGAGIYNINSASPTLNNCVISNNTAGDDGGGIYNENNSSPAISDCIITGNVGAGWGGGIRNENNSSPTITNSIISGNQAFIGGGILNWGESSPSIINSTISGNEADFFGGGIYNFASSNPSVINSTISGNKADADGGGIYNESESNPIIINSIIWNNSANGLTSSVSASVWNENLSNPQISYSIIANSGGSSSWDTNTGNDLGSNIDLDPLFVEDVDLGNLPTSDGNFRITTCSPAIDAGNPDTTGLNLPDLDLDGNSRIFNATGSGTDLIDMGAYEFQSTVPVDRPNTLYVNADNPTPGKGRSWDCAFSDLQLALAVAEAGDSIWVAAGTYLPTPGSDRNISFLLKNGVSIYGGFTGTETQLDQRDWENNATILSGDIGVQGDSSDNSFHVVRAGNGVTDALLDGFTITGGHANGGGTNVQGAGMRIFSGASVEIANCRIANNFAEDRGAGIKVLSATANIRNSVFENNSSDIGAGLLVNTSSVVNLDHCIFRNNDAVVRGGGVFYNSSSGEMRNCLFYDNYAGTEGGAIMMAVSATLNIVNSTIANNDAPTGGGILVVGSTATVSNSIFWNSNQQTGVAGNINATYSILEGTYSGTGVISSNPLFTDPDNGDFSLQQCSPAIDAGNNSVLNPSDTFDLAGNPRLFDATESGSPIVDMGAYEFQTVVPPTGNPNVIYVDGSNPSAGSGVSWECAFTDLQDALAAAEEGDTIWVAAGTYKPSVWPAGCSGCATDRDFTFLLRDGVSVYGGFAGTENLLSERDIEANETILSGDIGTLGDESDNVHHVVLVSFADTVPTTHLDGFTITGGNADGSGTITVNGNSIGRNRGSGIILEWGTNTLINNTVSDNMASSGGGISIRFGTNTLINNTVSDNVAIFDGGGIQSISAVTYISNNSILGNSSERGGGIFLFGGESMLSGNTVSENSAETQGGGIFTLEGTNNLLFNTVSANTAQFGSGVYSRECTNTMTNNLLLGNQAAFSGGGIYTRDGVSTITNNTLAGNSVTTNGAGIFSQNSTDTLTNNIIWGNSNGIFNSGSDLTVTYSIVQGGFPGTGNLDLDPLFVDQPPVGLGTAGDLRLQACSPAIDAGDNSALGTTDTLDLDGNPRFFDAFGQGVATVDLGAYEFQDTAATGGNPGTIYVNIQNQIPGSGLNWDCAFDDLQDALAVAQEGDTIWVAQGSYSPTGDSDPEVSFELVSGVVMLGGFDGTETSADQRDWQNNPTILDGDNGMGPNSYTVVYANNVDSTTVLDGFTIQGGTNNSFFSPLGGGIYINSGEPVIRNCTIQNNLAFEGGGVYMEDAAPVFINTTFFDNSTNEGGFGGGVYAYVSDPHFEECIFDLNFSFYGGGIYSEGSDVFIKDTEFLQQFATEFGGGILTDFSSQITIENSTFIDNEAGTGGAIAGDNSDINISGSSFTENSSFFGSGGAISSLGPFSILNVNILNSTFSNNSSPENCGGAIYIAGLGSILTIDSTDFLGNEAATGGAVCIQDSGQGTFNHLSFLENEAFFAGGAIFASNAELLSIENSDFQENSSTEDGGSIFSSSTLIFSIDNSEFLLNAADSFGGAIFHEQDSLVLTNSYFYENTAHCGGAIYTSEGGLQVSFTDFEMNIAAYRGGAHCALESKDYYEQVNFEKNEAAKGGAVYGDKTKSKFLHTKAKENKAQQKGGAYYKKEAEVEKKHSKIEENESESGGGIYSKKSEMNIDSSEFLKNMAMEDGGGFRGDSSKTYIKNSMFEENEAKNGGGIKTDGCEAELDRTELKKNVAAQKGGGMKNRKSKIDIKDSKINQNEAGDDGGGIKGDSSKTDIKNSIIEKNKGKKGGGIATKGCDITVKDTDIKDNEAVEKGGGVYHENTKKQYDGVNVDNNTAEQVGGGIKIKYAQDSSKMKNVNVRDNSALQKGGGMATDSSKIDFEDCNFSKNESEKGGNIYNKKSNCMYKNTKITGGKANKGGGMYNEKSSPKMINCQVTGNVALNQNNFQTNQTAARSMQSFLDGEGGGFFNEEGSPRLINLTLSGNYADDNGGGMYNTDSSNVEVSNTIVYNNQSGDGQDTLNSNVSNENSNPTFNNSVVEGANGSDDWNPEAGNDSGDNFDFDPQFVNELNPSSEPSEGGNFRLAGNSSAIDSGNDDDVPEDIETDIIGNARTSLFGVDIGAYERQSCQFDATNTIFVDVNRTDSVGTGQSWETAFNELFDALFLALDCDSTFFIFIAEGTYYPTDDPTDREGAVFLRNSLNILGGFPGEGSPDLTDRDWREFHTTISGDINRSGDSEGNSYSVVAVFDADSSAVLDGVTIRDGNADGMNGSPLSPLRAGAGVYIIGSDPTLKNLRIEENTAETGAGMLITGSASPSLNQIEILNNTALEDGGGLADISFEGQDTVIWSNLLIAGNSAGTNGGGIYLENQRDRIFMNTTVTQNMADVEGSAVYNDNSLSHFRNSIIWDNQASIFNQGSALTADFSIIQFPAGVYPGTGNLNANPVFSDPDAFDFSLTGCSPAINAGTSEFAPDVDLLGNIRPANSKIDMGAYEFQGSPEENCCPEGEIIYVDHQAQGVTNGSDWLNAFTNLQDALDLMCPEVTQIWIAEGTYYPTTDTMDRDSSFVIPSGISIYGGFQGDEESVEERNWYLNRTVLSGDINGSGTLDGNSHTVVVIEDAQSEVLLDGLFIAKGNADGDQGMVIGPHNSGGGLYIENSLVVGRNLYVEDNTSVHSGAGISIFESEVDLVNMVVTANYSEFLGGGLFLDGQSEVSLINATFSGNKSDDEGGAIYSQQGILSIFNSIIWNNSADSDSESLSASVSDLGTGLSISHSLISGSGGSGPHWNLPAASDGGGNLDVDPLFVGDVDFSAFPSISGDLNLTSCSPALDRGLNAAVQNLVSEDISGDPRLFNSTDKDSSVVDMGAYEFQGMAEFLDLNCDDILVFLDENGEKELTDDQLVTDAESCGTPGISWSGLDSLSFDCTTTGTYIVSVVGTDSASLRMDSCQFELTVSDTIAPTVSCDDTTIDLDANGMVTLEVGDFNYLASGNCAIDTLYVNNGEFSCSDVGTNIFEFVVTDINNNTTICSAEVEVINPFTPELDCRDTSIILDDTDMAMIEPGDIGEVTGSNCAIDSVWIDVNSFGCPEVGLNTVQFFAVDITGKKDSCSSEVTIVDEIVTMAQCKNLTVYLDSLGNASIEPEEVDDNSILSCSIINSQLDKSDFSCMDIGEFPVITLSFFDGVGVAGQCNSNVEVLDTIAPFVQCEDVTIEIEPGDAFVVLDPETLVGSASFDACGIDSSAVDKDTFFLQDLGENTVELTIQDPSGNAATCSAEVTVEGCPPFSLDCPSPDTIYVENGCAIVNLNYGSATSNDSPCPLEFSQMPLWGQVLSPGVYTQLVSAEDPAGNTASCSFELTVKDTIPPTVSCPQDGVVYVDENCTALLDDFTGEADASDNCGILETVQMPAAGYSLTADDTAEVTITVLDQSDNSATCSFSIVAVDTMSPTLQCDEDQIVRHVDGNCQAEVGDLTSLASPEDNCVTSFTTVQDIAADFVISAGDELTVTLLVSNENGWSGSCEIPVMAVDTLEPQLTCLIDSETVQVDIDCNASLRDYTGYAFVSDNCLAPGDFAVSQSPAVGSNLSPGDEFSVNLVTSDNGQWEDSCQINIVVVDPFDPVLNCQTENIVREVGPECLAEIGDLTSIATVSDNCLTGDAFTIDQNIPQDSMITAGGSVNAVLYVSDTTGWSAQCSVTVSAINESEFSWQDPLPMDDTLSCELEAEIVSLTVSDFCDTLSVYPTTDTTMGCMGIESLVFTWVFGDLSHSQTIVFVDDIPPVWLTHPLPQDTTVECDQIPAAVTLEAEDLCSEVIIEFDEEVLGDTIAGSYTLSRSWAAADHCGNEINHQQLLTVVDLTPPTIACPDTVVIDADQHCSVTMPDLRSQVAVDDNCSAIPNISISQIPSQGLTVILDEITVFTVAIDEAGNSTNCSFILKVENFGQDASIQCPAPVSVNAQEGDCDKFVKFEASFTQGCDGVVIVNDFNSGAEDASGVYPLGTTEVSFVLSQNGQPADSCVSSVEVLDVEVPELVCPDDVIVDTDPDACLATGILPGEALASSTCGNVLVSVDIPTSLEIGLNTIVHTAEADNGQTAQCEQIVEVLDANSPLIDCPDDLTVQVDSGQCLASGVETGDATASSLCGEVDIESDAPEIFPVGTTIVTYTATSDNDLEADCEQEVTITWMDAVEINCPDDITKVLTGGNCELEELDLGIPVLMPLCGDISIGSDAPGVFEAGITVVTHTASLPNGTELTCVQEIEVIDNYPMSIVCPENLVFITEPGICEVVNPVVGEAEVSTVCQSATVESDVPSVLLPGTHTVTHTASTGSGNEVSCEQIVEVQDQEDPTIVCPDDKAVQIPLGSSTAHVDLSLATADDNCGIDQISNNWNSGGADASGFYPSGETSVMFTALDVNGNSASCTTLISVQLVDTSLYSISGNVSSWNNVGISDVELALSGGLSESHFTDVDGDYQFEVPGSINLIISPEKDISWPTGISVVDLVMTQRHILQIETFDSPYRIIAADVNGSGSNSTIDLVIMQSIILGINNAEPNISPMVFIPADYQFSNPQNPFINNWPENLALQAVSGNKADQDFVAIKRGDVSGTAFSGIRLAAANPLELTLDAKNHENEGQVEVVVSGSVEKSIRGYQMEFSFDPGSLNFEGVEIKGSKMPDMRDELFHFDQENGVIRAIWYNAESVDLSNDKQLFSLRFSKSNPSISVKDHFGLITSPQSLMIFATGPDHPKIPIVSGWRSSEGVSVPGIIDVSPNPFRDLAVVNFEMPENQPVNIRVFDAAGAVIYDTRFHAVEGLNRYDLKLDKEASGALYLLLETSDWNQVINLIRIE